jgi:hypothetical protein
MLKTFKDEWLTFGCATGFIFSVLYATIAGINVINEIRLTAQELNTEINAFKVSYF